jgi:hypothetical protein
MDGKTVGRSCQKRYCLSAEPSRVPRYRMFAELLELAMQAGLKLDSSLPAYLPMSPTLQSPGGTPILESVLISSNAPTVLLQHPGYYYYAAADCSVQRDARFKELNGMASNSDDPVAEAKPQKISASAPGLANEQKIDHTALIIEASRFSQPDNTRKAELSRHSPSSYSQRHTVISGSTKGDKLV